MKIPELVHAPPFLTKVLDRSALCDLAAKACPVRPVITAQRRGVEVVGRGVASLGGRRSTKTLGTLDQSIANDLVSSL